MRYFGNKILKNISRILGKKQISDQTIKTSKASDFLLGKSDLPSIKEFVDTHIGQINKNDLKGKFTSDPATINIAQAVLGDGFFTKNIFSRPNYLSEELGSIKVLIADINDFSDYKKQYEQNYQRSVMLCVGGPAAEDQVVLANIISEIRSKLDDIIYITRNYKESNVNHSAKQSHARHGNALNADYSLSGHHLLPIILMRKLLGVDLEEVLEPDYKKIDVKFTIDPAKLRIYFGNELNWLRQEYRKLTGQLTEHDINRLESVLSQEIMHVVEKQAGVKLSGDADRSRQDSSAIHIVFTEENNQEVRYENEEFKKAGIESVELSKKEIELVFGDNQYIKSAYKYPGDTHIKFNIHEINKNIAEEKGAKWLDDEEIGRILLIKNKDGDAQIAGVVNKNGEYIYADKLHFTGGYKVDYIFDKYSRSRFEAGAVRNLFNKIEDVLGLQKPLNNKITTAAGVSVNAIFKKNDWLKKMIDEKRTMGEFAVTNSHWTMIADNDDYVVIRMTGGGNTGSEEYNPTYFLNLLANTRRIFGDNLIGILSSYGCPRAINAKNSTEFTEIAQGALISYGKGGTGNTKRHIEAAFGLMMLGFDCEIIDYFNQFDDGRNTKLGDELQEIYEQAGKMSFFHNNINKTNRRMGYDDSLSIEEIGALILFISALSLGLYKGLIKEKEKHKEL